jgi:hypothetical protein
MISATNHNYKKNLAEKRQAQLVVCKTHWDTKSLKLKHLAILLPQIRFMLGGNLLIVALFEGGWQVVQ